MVYNIQNTFGPVPKYLACWFKYSRLQQTNNTDIEIGCKLRLQQMSFLFHFHMLTLKTSLFKQFSWWCAILFFKPVWRASFWKIQKFREKEVGKWFLKWKTFFEEMKLGGEILYYLSLHSVRRDNKKCIALCPSTGLVQIF